MAEPNPAVCNDTPVIMVVDGRTIDRERMRAYTEQLLASGLYAKLGGYYLNTPRPIATFEGDVAVDHVTLMVRFPCFANAHAFWHSRAYQETIKPLRLEPMAGDFTVRIYPEIARPSYMTGKVEGNRYSAKFPAALVPGIADTRSSSPLRPSPSIRRMTFVVASIERSLAFYRDTLGLTAGTVRPLDAKGSGKSLFGIPADAAARFVTLDAGSTQREALGLVEYSAYRAVRTKSGRNVALVLKLPVSLDTVIPRLVRLGATLLPPSLAGMNREQAVLDPDGHLVVLYEQAR